MERKILRFIGAFGIAIMGFVLSWELTTYIVRYCGPNGTGIEGVIPYLIQVIDALIVLTALHSAAWAGLLFYWIEKAITNDTKLD